MLFSYHSFFLLSGFDAISQMMFLCYYFWQYSGFIDYFTAYLLLHVHAFHLQGFLRLFRSELLLFFLVLRLECDFYCTVIGFRTL
jgi:hypothetical protein